MERLYSYLVSGCVLGVMLIPITWDPLRDDSFPLSPYPMFSRPRPDPTVTLSYAVGVTDDGGRRWLAPEVVAADREVLQARAVVSRAVHAGTGEARRLCEAIAGRVAVREVRVVTGTHDAVDYLTGRDRTGAERVHVSCPVERSP